MNLKYVVIIGLIFSIISLAVSVFIYWENRLENMPPSGVKEVEIFKGNIKNVTLDSKDYYLTMYQLKDYVELKVETNSGWRIGYLYLDKPLMIYDLKITLKQMKPNSVIVWIQKIEH